MDFRLHKMFIGAQNECGLQWQQYLLRIFFLAMSYESRGSLQAFQHHEGTVLAHGRCLHHGLQVHPNPPYTKQLENLHQTNPCAVKTTNSNKVIKVVFMVSNVLYNIQQHEIKWGIYRSQCSVYLFTTLMTSSRTSRKWSVSEAIINQSKSDLYKSFSNKGFVSRLK